MNPGFSFLESPFAPTFTTPEKRTIAAVRSFMRGAWPALAAIVVELLAWWMGRDVGRDQRAQHFWALPATISVASTAVGALLTSAWAAAASGVATLAFGAAAALFVGTSSLEITSGAAAVRAFGARSRLPPASSS